MPPSRWRAPGDVRPGHDPGQRAGGADEEKIAATSVGVVAFIKPRVSSSIDEHRDPRSHKEGGDGRASVGVKMP